MAERRWYDKDSVLKEALDLLKIACDENDPNQATEFMLKLQEDVAGEVIEHVYEIVSDYHGKGKRWYDKDPIVVKAVELLRTAPKNTQRKAALKLLMALEDQTEEKEEQQEK